MRKIIRKRRQCMEDEERTTKNKETVPSAFGPEVRQDQKKHGNVPAETGMLAAKNRLHTHALLVAEMRTAGNIALCQ